jgi:hypothetical protein
MQLPTHSPKADRSPVLSAKENKTLMAALDLGPSPTQVVPVKSWSKSGRSRNTVIKRGRGMVDTPKYNQGRNAHFDATLVDPAAEEDTEDLDPVADALVPPPPFRIFERVVPGFRLNERLLAMMCVVLAWSAMVLQMLSWMKFPFHTHQVAPATLPPRKTATSKCAVI